jgi:hypothetical protein
MEHRWMLCIPLQSMAALSGSRDTLITHAMPRRDCKSPAPHACSWWLLVVAGKNTVVSAYPTVAVVFNPAQFIGSRSALSGGQLHINSPIPWGTSGTKIACQDRPDPLTYVHSLLHATNQATQDGATFLT